MLIFGIPLFDNDLYKLLFRFLLNFSFLSIIIYTSYYKIAKRTKNIFAYYVISSIVFVLCFTLKKYELDMGVAFGLFAIFGIIRYRTDPISTHEMGYLFISIGLSVINALANKSVSYAELLFCNIFLVLLILVLELLSRKRISKSISIVYEDITNVNLADLTDMKADLSERLQVNVVRIVIDKVDYLKDSANIVVFYKDVPKIK